MLAVLAVSAAAAFSPPLDLARIGGTVSTIQGSRRLGEGTREGYRGSAIALDFDVLRFPSPHAGFEIGFLWGGTAVPWGHKATTYRIELAADLVLFSHERGSVIVGLGPGLDLGDRLWFSPDGVRGNVGALLRTRFFPTKDWAVHANSRLDLFATGDLVNRRLRAELLVSWSLAMVGLQWTRTWVVGGTPSRTYVEDQLGLSLSVAVHG